MIGDWMGDTLEPMVSWYDTTLTYDTARAIADKPSVIIVQRPAAGGAFTDLPEQTVRLETLGSPRNVDGGLTVSGPQQILVLGYRGHPNLPDANIRRGDRFFTDGITYTITALLVDTRVSLQAIGEAKP